jgi:hypothetical protein
VRVNLRRRGEEGRATLRVVSPRQGLPRSVFAALFAGPGGDVFGELFRARFGVLVEDGLEFFGLGGGKTGEGRYGEGLLFKAIRRQVEEERAEKAGKAGGKS